MLISILAENSYIYTRPDGIKVIRSVYTDSSGRKFVTDTAYGSGVKGGRGAVVGKTIVYSGGSRKKFGEGGVSPVRVEEKKVEEVAQPTSDVQQRSIDIQQRGGYYDFGTGKYVARPGVAQYTQQQVESQRIYNEVTRPEFVGLEKVKQNELRSNRNIDRTDSSNNFNVYDKQVVKQEKSGFQIVVESAGETIISPFRGFAKATTSPMFIASEGSSKYVYKDYPYSSTPISIFYNPKKQSNFFGSQKEFAESNLIVGREYRKTPSKIFLEPDVVNSEILIAGGSLMSTGIIGKSIVVGASSFYTGYQGAKIVSNPTAENIGVGVGTAAFFALPFAKKINPIRMSILEIPQVAGESSIIKSVGVGVGRWSQTIVSKTPEGIRFGTPDITGNIKNLPVTEQIKPAGFLQTDILNRNLKLISGGDEFAMARRQEAIGVGQGLIRRTVNTKSKFISELPSGTERMDSKATSIVLGVAKEEGATVFGSFSRRAQIPEKVSDFVPRDVDVRLVDASPKNLERVRGTALSRLESAGFDVRPTPGKSEAIDIKVAGGSYEKAVEFKGKGLVDEDVVPDFVLGYAKEGKSIKISGQRLTSLNEELRGVSQGVFRISNREGVIDVYPSPKRAKDIQSTFISAETLSQSKIFNVGLKKDIVRFKELYPDAFKKQNVIDLPIVDYNPIKSSSVGGRGSVSTVLFMGKSDYNNQNKLDDYSMSPSSSSSPFRIMSPSIIPFASSSSSSPLKVNSLSVYSGTSRSSSPIKNMSPSVSSSPFNSMIPSSSKSSSSSPIKSTSLSTSSSRSSSSYSSLGYSSSSTNGFTSSGSSKSKSPFFRDVSNGGGLFDVFVRRGGRFFKVNREPLNIKNAFGTGTSRVSSTAAASFKVIPRTAEGRVELKQELLKQNNKYYLSKREPNVVIQKNKFRISSSGEKREITLKGINTQKLKRLSKRKM